MYSMAEEKDSVRKKVGRPRKYSTAAERQKAVIARKLESTVQIRTFITPEARNDLRELCKEYGMTQGELLTELIRDKKNSNHQN